MRPARLYFSLSLTVRWLAFVGLIVTHTRTTLAPDEFGGFTSCQIIGTAALARHCLRL
jgi:hypothetical protein